ncbi:hypothetical protein BDZ89DRAFT_937759, partial [Hymenopellis radicata]
VNDAVHRLRAVFPDNLILAAFDIIDREHAMKYETPSGYTYYEVVGSSGTYTVTLGMNNSPTRNFCPCPAYSYAVLIAKTHIMCKHILAVKLASRLSAFNERPMDLEELCATLQLRFGV